MLNFLLKLINQSCGSNRRGKRENGSYQTTVSMGKIYSVCQWIYRLAYSNVLWLLFMTLGLFVFGAVPSTVAMFAIIRKWIKGETEFPVLSFFGKSIKKSFGNRII